MTNQNYIQSYNLTSKGFIALMATIVIGVVLLVLAATLARTGWNLRYQVLGAEYKSLSRSLAEGCAARALMLRIQDGTYGGNATSSEAAGTCYIAPLSYSPATHRLQIYVTAVVQESYTTLEYQYDVQNIFMGMIPLGVGVPGSGSSQEPTLISRQEISVMP